MSEMWQWTGLSNDGRPRGRNGSRGRQVLGAAVGATCVEVLEQRRLMSVAPDVLLDEGALLEEPLIDLPLVQPPPDDTVVTLPPPEEDGVASEPAGTGTFTGAAASSTPLGPNLFGYTAREATYEEIDLAPGGDVAQYNLANDEAVAVWLNGNSFNFYGTTYSDGDLFVSTNGLVTFGAPNPVSENFNLADPLGAPAEATIAPLWDDWAPSGFPPAFTPVLAKLEVSAAADVTDRLILEWNAVTTGDPSVTATFQVILELNTGTRAGEIVFNYKDLDLYAPDDGAAGATVGIKKAHMGEEATTDELDALVVFNGSFTPPNAPPVATGTAVRISNRVIAPVAGDDQFSTPEDVPAQLDVLANDTGAGPLTVSVGDGPDHGTAVAQDGGVFYTPAQNFNGTDTFTYVVTDAGGGTDEATVTVNVSPVADAPTLTVGAVNDALEGDVIPLGITAGVSDSSEGLTLRVYGVPEGATLSSQAVNLGGGTWALNPSNLGGLTLTVGDEGPVNLTVKATVMEGGTEATTSRHVQFNVSNVAPTATLGLIASQAQFARGTPIDLVGTFNDPGFLDTHDAVWTLTSNSSGQSQVITPAVTVSEENHTASIRVNTATNPLAAGVYYLKLTVSDNDGGTTTVSTVGGTAATIVVFDAQAGFVGGIGWLRSTAGMLVSNPTWTGSSYFAFVSGYLPGSTTPSGVSGFTFKAAGSTFRTTSYDWMVVSGPKAQYTGSGTVNGVTGYRFTVTLIDGQKAGGGGVDRLRLKVWKVVNLQQVVWYDNQPGADDDANPTISLGGGDIVIVS